MSLPDTIDEIAPYPILSEEMKQALLKAFEDEVRKASMEIYNEWLMTLGTTDTQLKSQLQKRIKELQ